MRSRLLSWLGFGSLSKGSIRDRVAEGLGCRGLSHVKPLSTGLSKGVVEYMRTCRNVYEYARAYTSIRAYVYIQMYIYIYTYICIYDKYRYRSNMSGFGV